VDGDRNIVPYRWCTGEWRRALVGPLVRYGSGVVQSTPWVVTERLTDDDLAVPLIVQAAARAGIDRASAAAEIRTLVDATFDVIATKGSCDPQVRDILDRAKLSRQVFYRHFQSKDELLLVVLDESWRIVASYVSRRIARAEGAEAQLRAWIAGVLRQAQDADVSRRTRPFAITGRRLEAQFPKEFAQARQSFVGQLADVIDDGIREGVFESNRPVDDALIIHDAVFLRQNRHLVLGTYPTRKAVDQLHEFALRALRPTNPGTTPR
jgi:AcrR family transcriptional regulator